MLEYSVTITGKTPYMQHRMDDVKLAEWENKRGKIIERHDARDDDQKKALYHSFMNESGEFYIPGDHIRGALIGAGTTVKAKVGAQTKSMKSIVAGSFWTKEDEIAIKGDKMTIDKRSAVNRNVKARVITVRPKWENWNATFTLQVDNDTITDDTIKALLENAGNYIGIGSFRPTNNGKFGRFEVTKFKQIK